MLTWSGYTLEFEPEGEFRRPTFVGSMLRGAFGPALKRIVCAMRLRACDGCPLEHACIYTTVFETRPVPGSGLMTLYNRAPHPFVLVTGSGATQADGTWRAGVRLFGDATRATPFVLRAFEEAAERGFGTRRVRHRLASAQAEGGRAVWRPGDAFPLPELLPAPVAWPDAVRLRFRTPLRIRRENDLVTPERLDGPTLVMSAVRRFGLLAGFFGGGASGIDFRALKAAAQATRLADADLRWHDLVRRSSRQQALLGIGGIEGEATLYLGGSKTLAAILAWAPVMHVGKGTTMGLGQVEAEPAK